MTIASDVQRLDIGTIVDMYVLDLTVINHAAVFYFHPGLNALENDVVWQEQVYTRWPIEVRGYDLSGKGVLPRPSLKVANLDGSIGALCALLEDMVGATVTRKRTLAKYLDAVNFPGGVNPTANPLRRFNDEVYSIERKTQENEIFVQFELTAAWDVTGVKVPRRQIIPNACPHLYRNADYGCPYSGEAMFDLNDEPTLDPAQDRCSKRLQGCRVRFPDTDLPYGAFPLVLQA